MRISGDLTEHPNVTWVWASLPLPPFRPYSPLETVLGPQISQRFWKQQPKGQREEETEGTTLASSVLVTFGSSSLHPHPVDPIAARLKEVRLQRDDFEILKVIGRGAFSEVSLERPESGTLLEVGGA